MTIPRKVQKWQIGDHYFDTQAEAFRYQAECNLHSCIDNICDNLTMAGSLEAGQALWRQAYYDAIEIAGWRLVNTLSEVLRRSKTEVQEVKKLATRCRTEDMP